MKKTIAFMLLLVCALMCLTSCAPKEPADARALFKKEGYTAEIFNRSGDIEERLDKFDVDETNIEVIVEAFDWSIEGFMTFAYVIYCTDKKGAKYVESDIIAFMENDLEEWLDLSTEGYGTNDFCVIRRGKIVIFGLKEIVDIVT